MGQYPDSVHCPSCQADDTKVVDSRLAEEGARRAISFSFSPVVAVTLPGAMQMDTMLESFREADGITFDNDGD